VILTVNGLPEDYTGHLDITINDLTVFVTLRNMLLLSILGKAIDVRKAADAALHIWYSAFLPPEYHILLAGHGVKLIESRQLDGTFFMKLGPQSSMDGIVGKDETLILGQLVTSKYSAADVNQERHRVQCVALSNYCSVDADELQLCTAPPRQLASALLSIRTHPSFVAFRVSSIWSRISVWSRQLSVQLAKSNIIYA
jgi:hypothetical protein